MASVGGAVAELRRVRGAWRARQENVYDVESFPSHAAIARIVETFAAALYPRRLGQFHGGPENEDAFVEARLIAGLGDLEREIAAELGYWQTEARLDFPADQAATITRLFAGCLGEIREAIDSDVEAAFLADPAARSVDEILICYPGAIASLHHRLAHQLHNLGAPIVARLISELANERTGIDIHPGATIGRNFFIDHGTGVVIGETSIVGDRVRLYQHVTLGARSVLGCGPRSPGRPLARHPIVEDDVVIYAGATILGRVRIGARSVIGGNVWLLSDVDPDTVLVQSEACRLASSAAAELRDDLRRAV